MVVFSLDEDRLICAFSGQMDTLTTASLTSEVTARAAEASGPVVFDLAEVEYVSSAFLRLCLQVGRQKGAGQLSLVHVRPQVLKVLKIAGFDKILSVGPS
jgi:anti-anti-sigma factor